MFIFAGAAVVELILSRISGSLIWLTQRLLLCSGKEGGSSRLSGAGGRAALPLSPPVWPDVTVKSPSNYGLRALLSAFLEKLLHCFQQRRPRFSVPKWNEAKWTCLVFFILATGAGEGESQVAQEAEVFCSSVLGLNTTQIDRNQKLCVHIATQCLMRSELGTCGLAKLPYTVRICQLRAYVAHLSQNVKTQGKYYKGCEKCPFHSCLKLMLAKPQSPCPYSVSFMENRLLQCLGGSCLG